jgi:hypothetical protein
MRRRDIHQRRTYALRRASKAVERLITAQSLDERLKASYWEECWGVLAGVRPARRG